MSERWFYNWIDAGKGPWTRAEKLNFHRQCDLAIWAAWSNRARLKVSGKSPFAQRFSRRTLGINLDIHGVLSNQHWTVNGKKVVAGEQFISNVVWQTHNIYLANHDFEPVFRHRPEGVRKQVTVAHEFGHAAGNSATFGMGDEYPSRKARLHLTSRTSSAS